MKRRQFIQSVSTVSAPFMLGGIPVGLAKPLGLSNLINGDSDRILVLIQLNGGNDGLNTVVPLDNYDELANLRSNILIPENKLLPISATQALHPAMAGIRGMYDQGMVQVIQNVGYPDQNRSHFRSTDIWNTASDADQFVDTGWLGRYFGDQFPEYPDGFPNADCPDPLAITIGNFVSETCQGTATNYSIAVGDIDQIGSLDDPNAGNLPDNCYGHEMEFLIEAIQKTNAYAERLTEAAEGGINTGEYPDGDRFAAQLMTTARLISGGLQTKIYLVSIGGFDTHADQVTGDTNDIGVHADLWQSVSDSITAFYDDMRQQGLAERILCMTFSEFGRQIRSNGSRGTDHGTAAPMLLFGDCLAGGVTGDNIPIDVNGDPQAGVPMQYDFRDVYGTVLEKWFDVDETAIRQYIYADYQHLQVFSDDCFVSSTEDVTQSQTVIRLWPNPAFHQIEIASNSSELTILSVELLNSLGARLLQRNVNSNQLSLSLNGLSSGQYFLRIRSTAGFIVKPFIKL